MVVDGDRLLVLAQKQIISMAKRVMDGVYPLYYEMKTQNVCVKLLGNRKKGIVIVCFITNPKTKP